MLCKLIDMKSQELYAIIQELQEDARQAERAIQMKAYMKDRYKFLGITAPIRKVIFRELWAQYKRMILADWKGIVQLLWNDTYRESKYFAMEIIRKVEKQLILDDLPFIENLIVEESWWDTVDFLASHAVGHILIQQPAKSSKIAHDYMDTENMWLQRTALIFQLFYKDKTEASLLSELVLKTVGSKEFFINKASGWALRQYSRTDKVFVREFLAIHGDQLSGLTKREGGKYI